MSKDDRRDPGQLPIREDTGAMWQRCEQVAPRVLDADQVCPVLRPAVSVSGPLHHLARCTDGNVDLAVDALDGLLSDMTNPASHALRSAGQDARSAREALRHMVQRLSLVTARLDRKLEPARSGSLIRLVVQTDLGCCTCCEIIPNSHLVGVLLSEPGRQQGGHPRGHPEAASADMAVSRAVTELRQMISQGSLDPGGYEHAGPLAARRRATRQAVFGVADEPMLSRCRDALSPDDLHYVGFVHRRKLRFAVDAFEDPALAAFFGSVTAATRRRFHHGFATQFGSVAEELHRIVRPILSTAPTRIVLDVEQGALYLQRVPGDDYLVGVTLNQCRVSHADRLFDSLATQWEAP